MKYSSSASFLLTVLLNSLSPTVLADGGVFTTTCWDFDGSYLQFLAEPLGDGETVSVLNANPSATTYVAITDSMTQTHVDGPSTFALSVTIDMVGTNIYRYDYTITGPTGGVQRVAMGPETETGLPTITASFAMSDLTKRNIYITGGQDKLQARPTEPTATDTAVTSDGQSGTTAAATGSISSATSSTVSVTAKTSCMSLTPFHLNKC
jgi:hypothetical protein